MATHNHQIKRLMTSATKSAKPWLCFTAESENSTIRLNKVGSPDPVSLETSPDGKTWTPYSWSENTGAAINLNRGDKCYWRGDNSTFSKDADNNYYNFSTSRNVALDGNIMSLLDKSCTLNVVPGNCFSRLFLNNNISQIAPNLLPAVYVGNGSYRYMFMKSTWSPAVQSFTTGIDFSRVRSMAGACMYRFYERSQVQKVALPPVTAADIFYQAIRDCDRLTEVELLGTSVDSIRSCYEMCKGCTSLNKVKVHFTTWPTSTDALKDWLDGVAATGTFYCPDELPDPTPAQRGASTVPEGWTIIRPIDGYVKDGLVFQLDAKKGKEASTWTDLIGGVQLSISAQNDTASGNLLDFPKGYTIEMVTRTYAGTESNNYPCWEDVTLSFGENKATIKLEAYDEASIIIPGGGGFYVNWKVKVKTNEGFYDAQEGYDLRLPGGIALVSAKTSGQTIYGGNGNEITMQQDTLATSGGTYIKGVKFIKSIRVYNRELTDREREINRALDIQRFG